MKANAKYFLLFAMTTGLLLAGCGKPPADTQLQPAVTQLQTDTAPRPPRIETQPPAPPVDMAATAVATSEAPSGAAEFATAALASPFAQAEMALMESYNRALIAFQIGDYSRAVTELQDLADTPDLNPQQKQAVQDLLAKTLKLAPELAQTSAAAAAKLASGNPTSPEFALAGESPNNLPDDPFATADPAIKQTFARAKAAFNIDDYAKALAELQDLAANPQLNWQQKYAVQALLDKTPQIIPAVPAAPPGQTPRR